jgi:putative RecB family exonuclease
VAQELLELSPSSAANFKSCPQLFKFRSIERLEEPVSSGQARGSLVHAALERLFAEPPDRRSPDHASALLRGLWAEVRGDPEWRPSELGVDEEDRWLRAGESLLANLFKIEDPCHVEASRLEWWVECELPDLYLRGIIDRVEEDRDGSWILTDYKTGRTPGESRELAASFGVRFYALMCWRSHGVLPRELRLVYLADPVVLRWRPTERSLLAFERQLCALRDAIKRAAARDDWRARPSPLCLHCSFQDRCPAWQETAQTD